MSPEAFVVLLVSGLTNGAIYALLGLGLVLIYGVTRVVNIAQGEFVTLGALTAAGLLAGRLPATLDLALVAGVVWAVWEALRLGARGLPLALLAVGGGVALRLALGAVLAGPLPYLLAALLAVALVGFLGAAVYRFAIQPVPEDSEGLVFLIITTGLFIAFEGFSLLTFGSQGNTLPPILPGEVQLEGGRVLYQQFFVLGGVALLLLGLWAYFERTISGKALRAAAVNRLGSRLVGISPARSGVVAWALSAAMGALGGVLFAPIFIVNYDTGLPLGLKGFIGAVISGFASYPGAVLGGVVVGVLESFAGFINSTYKEVIVYSLLFVILVGRSLRARRRRPAGVVRTTS